MTFASYQTSQVDGVLGTIVTEWQDRFADRVEDFGSLGIRRTGDLEQHLHNLPKPEVDAALHVLLSLEHEGHEVAGRLLLQLMLPKVAHMVRSCTGFQQQRVPRRERTWFALEAMWEAIRTYPLRRTNSVAGNIALNALAIITKTFGTYRTDNVEYSRPDDVIEDLLNADGADAAEPRWGDTAFHHLVDVLTWAVDSEALSRDEVALLARFDLGEPEDRAALAEELSLSPATLSKRVWRIRNKLIEAVRTHISTFGRW